VRQGTSCKAISRWEYFKGLSTLKIPSW
jgi:hypothetical protein